MEKIRRAKKCKNKTKALYKSREKIIRFLDDYTRKYAEFLKLLTSKQMLQRLLIALRQVKAGKTSENLLNEIRQIIYYLH